MASPQLDLRKLFVAALLIGGGGILAGQWLDSRVMAVTPPLAVMAAYMALGFYRGSANAILEPFADSIYYLGFLFTLLALVASLYAFRAEGLAIGQLVGNFALALVTTITGLAARIVITNFRSDEFDQRRHLRDQLEQSTQDLILNARSISLRLEGLINEFQYTLGTALEQTAGAVTRSATTIEQQHQAGSAALDRQLDEVGARLAGAVEQLRRKLGRIEMPEDLIRSKLSGPLDDLVERFSAQQLLIDRQLQRHDAILEQSHSLTSGLGRTAARVGQLERALRGFEQRLDDDQQARQSIVELSRQLATLLDTHRQLVDSSDRQVHNARQAATDLETLIGDITGLQSQVEDTTTTLARGGQALSTAVAGFEQDAKRSAAISGSVAAIADAFEQARDGVAPIGEIGRQLSAHATLLADIERLAGEQLAMLQQHQDGMQQTLAASRETLGQVNRHFIDAVDYVNDRLGSE